MLWLWTKNPVGPREDCSLLGNSSRRRFGFNKPLTLTPTPTLTVTPTPTPNLTPTLTPTPTHKGYTPFDIPELFHCLHNQLESADSYVEISAFSFWFCIDMQWCKASFLCSRITCFTLCKWLKHYRRQKNVNIRAKALVLKGYGF